MKQNVNHSPSSGTKPLLRKGNYPKSLSGYYGTIEKNLKAAQARKQFAGPVQHREDFFTPYRTAAWFFEVVEFAKKLLLIGIIPAVNGDVVGAVIAMLLVNLYLVLLLKHGRLQFVHLRSEGNLSGRGGSRMHVSPGYICCRDCRL